MQLNISSLQNRDSEIFDLQQRLSRNLSSMNVFLGGSARRSRMLSNTSQRLAGSDSTETGVSQVESDEETINLLIDMDFTRKHPLDAIESTGSNRLEVVMEYAYNGTELPTNIELNNDHEACW